MNIMGTLARPPMVSSGEYLVGSGEPLQREIERTEDCVIYDLPYSLKKELVHCDIIFLIVVQLLELSIWSADKKKWETQKYKKKGEFPTFLGLRLNCQVVHKKANFYNNKMEKVTIQNTGWKFLTLLGLRLNFLFILLKIGFGSLQYNLKFPTLTKLKWLI